MADIIQKELKQNDGVSEDMKWRLINSRPHAGI